MCTWPLWGVNQIFVDCMIISTGLYFITTFNVGVTVAHWKTNVHAYIISKIFRAPLRL